MVRSSKSVRILGEFGIVVKPFKKSILLNHEGNVGVADLRCALALRLKCWLCRRLANLREIVLCTTTGC
jgi:hypothetical protein